MGELVAGLDTRPSPCRLGRSGQHRYNNLDHSMLTIPNAVDALLSGPGDRPCAWGVNTEDEYHEERQG